MVKKICRDCKKEFEAKMNSSRFPKKYCDKCSAERKEAYKDIHNISASDCEDE
jgi:hypothetical protein